MPHLREVTSTRARPRSGYGYSCNSYLVGHFKFAPLLAQEIVVLSALVDRTLTTLMGATRFPLSPQLVAAIAL